MSATALLPTMKATTEANTMTLECIECADRITFWNPSAQRVDWFERSHRCGGSYWQEGPPPADFTVVEVSETGQSA